MNCGRLSNPLPLGTAQLGTFAGRLQLVSGTSIALASEGRRGAVEVRGGVLPLGAGLACPTSAHTIDADGDDSGAGPVLSTLYHAYVGSLQATFGPGSVRLSTVAPTEDEDGIKYLGTTGNAAEWRFVGRVYVDASVNFRDDATARFIVNEYNRRPLHLLATPSPNDNNAPNQVNVTATTYALLNGGTGDTVSFVANGEDSISARLDFAVKSGSASGMSHVGIGLDGALSAVRSTVINASPSSVFSMSVGHVYTPAAGLRTIEALACTPAGGTLQVWVDMTRYGSAADPVLTALTAVAFG